MFWCGLGCFGGDSMDPIKGAISIFDCTRPHGNAMGHIQCLTGTAFCRVMTLINLNRQVDLA